MLIRDIIENDEPTRIKIGGNNEAAKTWIAKVYAKYPHTMQNNHVMVWGEGDDQQFAMFELVPSFSKRGAVEVKWFQAYPLRQGVGSKAMKELQTMAREDGIALTLFPWDKGQVSQAKLTKFYRGQGFKPTVKGGKAMAWETSVAEAAASSQYAKLYHSTPVMSLDAILQSGYLSPIGGYVSLTRDSRLDYGSWAGSDSFVEFDIDQNAVRQRIKLEPYNHSATMGGPRATGGGESEERIKQKLPLKGFVTAMHAPTTWEGDKAGEHYGNLLKKYGVPIIYDIVPKL